MSFGFVAARAHCRRTISRRRHNFGRRCATFRRRCATSPCFVARSRGGSPTYGLYLTGWARCLAICSTLDAPSLIFPPRCAQNCPEVSKIHTARKTEQVIVRLILRERDYVWYRTFESRPTTFVGRPSFFWRKCYVCPPKTSLAESKTSSRTRNSRGEEAICRLPRRENRREMPDRLGISLKICRFACEDKCVFSACRRIPAVH